VLGSFALSYLPPCWFRFRRCRCLNDGITVKLEVSFKSRDFSNDNWRSRIQERCSCLHDQILGADRSAACGCAYRGAAPVFEGRHSSSRSSSTRTSLWFPFG